VAHELALFVFIDALGVELAERHRFLAAKRSPFG